MIFACFFFFFHALCALECVHNERRLQKYGMFMSFDDYFHSSTSPSCSPHFPPLSTFSILRVHRNEAEEKSLEPLDHMQRMRALRERQSYKVTKQYTKNFPTHAHKLSSFIQ
jgi:hypothetical protein